MINVSVIVAYVIDTVYSLFYDSIFHFYAFTKLWNLCWEYVSLFQSVFMKRNEMNMKVQPSLHYLCLSLYVKVSCFNEKAAKVKWARGLHLPDMTRDPKPDASMLILVGAPWELPPLAWCGHLSLWLTGPLLGHQPSPMGQSPPIIIENRDSAGLATALLTN